MPVRARSTDLVVVVVLREMRKGDLGGHNRKWGLLLAAVQNQCSLHLHQRQAGRHSRGSCCAAPPNPHRGGRREAENCEGDAVAGGG